MTAPASVTQTSKCVCVFMHSVYASAPQPGARFVHGSEAPTVGGCVSYSAKARHVRPGACRGGRMVLPSRAVPARPNSKWPLLWDGCMGCAGVYGAIADAPGKRSAGAARSAANLLLRHFGTHTYVGGFQPCIWYSLKVGFLVF